MKQRKVTSLYIDPEVWQAARENARKRGLSLCDYIEMLIRKDLIAVQLEEIIMSQVKRK